MAASRYLSLRCARGRTRGRVRTAGCVGPAGVEVLALGPVEVVSPGLRDHVADLARRTPRSTREAESAPPISLLRPTKTATTSSATVTSTSYTPSRPTRSRSVAVATSRSPSRVGRRKRISAPAATVLRL